jgi:hypothetical protein
MATDVTVCDPATTATVGDVLMTADGDDITVVDGCNDDGGFGAVLQSRGRGGDNWTWLTTLLFVSAFNRCNGDEATPSDNNKPDLVVVGNKLPSPGGARYLTQLVPGLSDNDSPVVIQSKSAFGRLNNVTRICPSSGRTSAPAFGSDDLVHCCC